MSTVDLQLSMNKSVERKRYLILEEHPSRRDRGVDDIERSHSLIRTKPTLKGPTREFQRAWSFDGMNTRVDLLISRTLSVMYKQLTYLSPNVGDE